MRVMTVLKCGGEYNEGHVAWLRKQFPDDVPFDCLTDSSMPDKHFEAVTGANPIRLQYGAWGGRGWWAKLELFRPDIKGDFLFVDLDTVIIDVDKLAGAIVISHHLDNESPIVLSDFYFPTTAIGSGLMYLPEACRAAIWDKWIADPAGHISRNHGDQDFLTPWFWGANRWQNVAPFAVVSYKAHLNSDLGGRYFKPGFNDLSKIAVVCFHGNPRPWHVHDAFVPFFGGAS